MSVERDGRGGAHIDKALTNVSIEYRPQGFIADMVAPNVPVDKQSDKYFVFDKNNFKLENTLRAEKTASNLVNSYTVSSDSYFCNVHSLHDLVSDSEKANTDAPINPEISATTRLTDRIMVRKEYEVASALFNATTFASYTDALTGTEQWNDYTDSTPDTDIDNAKTQVLKNSGRRANTVIMGKEVYDKVKRHPDVLDAFKYTSKGIITPQMLAEFFGIERVIVGDTPYDSAVEGGTASMSYMWGKYVLVAYISKSPAINEPSCAYNFNWKIWGGKTVKVKKWRDEDLDSNKIEVSSAFNAKVTSASSGYLLTTVVA